MTPGLIDINDFRTLEFHAVIIEKIGSPFLERIAVQTQCRAVFEDRIDIPSEVSADHFPVELLSRVAADVDDLFPREPIAIDLEDAAGHPDGHLAGNGIIRLHNFRSEE